MFVERLLNSWNRLLKPPRFVPAYDVRGLRSTGETAWREPDGVHGRGIHRPKNAKVDDIRPIPEAIEARLVEIDAERAAIKKRQAELFVEERELLMKAFIESKPLPVKECENAPY